MSLANRKGKTGIRGLIARSAKPEDLRPPVEPIKARYLREKHAHGDLLAFRLGDYYEFLYGDATIVADTLGLVVTQRGDGPPMTGVPAHSFERYVAPLADAGYTVSVIGPAKRGKNPAGYTNPAVYRSAASFTPNRYGVTYVALDKSYAQEFGKAADKLFKASLVPRKVLDLTQYAADETVTAKELTDYLRRKGVDVHAADLRSVESRGGEILQYIGSTGYITDAARKAGYKAIKLNEYDADSGKKAVTYAVLDQSLFGTKPIEIPNPAGYTNTVEAMGFYTAARRMAKKSPYLGANEALKTYLGQLPAPLRAKALTALKAHSRNNEAWHTGWTAGQQAGEIAQRRNPWAPPTGFVMQRTGKRLTESDKVVMTVERMAGIYLDYLGDVSTPETAADLAQRIANKTGDTWKVWYAVNSGGKANEFTVKPKAANPKTKLDLYLDAVEAGKGEITFDVRDGYTEAQKSRIIAEAEARGLHASGDGKYILVRDLRKMHQNPKGPKVTLSKTSLWEKREDGTGRWEKINTADIGYLQELQKYSKRESRIQDKTPEMDGIKVVKGRFVSRNPAPAAADVYEMFHGVPSTETIAVSTPIHHHDNLAALGELVELQINPTYGKMKNRIVKLSFAGCKVTLAANESATQLYFVGGDQSVPLDGLGLDKPQYLKDVMLLGVCYELTYNTKKKFDKLQSIDYYHAVGEVSKECPVITYNPITKQLSIAGGAYTIEDRGIVN